MCRMPLGFSLLEAHAFTIKYPSCFQENTRKAKKKGLGLSTVCVDWFIMMYQGGSWGQAGVRKKEDEEEEELAGRISGEGHFKTLTSIELNYFSKFFAPSVKTLS